MTFLFLDTSHALTLGLLNEKSQWQAYELIPGGRTATQLHEALHSLLNRHSLKLKNLAGAVQVAGPGSYTGMRISDGLFQTLHLAKLKTSAFYHFEVPALLGMHEGLWLSNAFKGEIFTYRWNGKTGVQKLFLEKDFVAEYELTMKNLPLFTHDKNAFSPTFKTWVDTHELKETSKLIQDSPENLFPPFLATPSFRPVFYYRAIEQEFKKPN